MLTSGQAYDLASRGAKVVLTYSSDRSKQGADELISRIKSEVNSSAIGIQCNLQSTEAPQQIVDAALQAFGPHIDILVNNAAMSEFSLGHMCAEYPR